MKQGAQLINESTMILELDELLKNIFELLYKFYEKKFITSLSSQIFIFRYYSEILMA